MQLGGLSTCWLFLSGMACTEVCPSLLHPRRRLTANLVYPLSTRPKVDEPSGLRDS